MVAVTLRSASRWTSAWDPQRCATSKVSAEISVGTIIVHGEVNGNIRAKNAIELHHPARVRGNVETPSLMIEKGVIFEGQAKMENLEKGGAAKPAVAVTAPAVAAVKP